MKIDYKAFIRHMTSKKVLKAWLPLAFVVTAVIGFAYVATQQNYRMSANDPQIQIVKDYQYFLGQGQGVPLISSANKIQVGMSLSPFVEFFNASSTFMTSSGNIGEDVPIPPAGTFAYAKEHGQNRFSWEPRPGIRLAAVMGYWTGPNDQSGYIVSARNLSEIEKRIQNLTVMSGIAWAITMVGSLVLCAFAIEKSHTTHA